MSTGYLNAAVNADKDTDRIIELIDQLEKRRSLTREEWIELIRGRDDRAAAHLFERARETRIRYYGHDVYIRGLIEFTNYCRNDCYYCGIRKSNPMPSDTALLRTISLHAVNTAMSLVSALLCSRAERTDGLQTADWQISSLPSVPGGQTARSHSL